MKPRAAARPHGQLRRSQVVTTFGPGAMIDLPGQSVVVGGLEHWGGDPVQQGFQSVHEPRLLDKIRQRLERPDMRMYAPPIDVALESRTGITVWLFPEWFLAQHDERSPNGLRSRRLLPKNELVGGKYFSPEKKRHPVVPVRFVQACVNGHLADLEWHAFAHEYQGDCRRKLWLDERGASGDLADLFVRCECGQANRSLARALPSADRPFPIGFCRGERPWLGRYAREECTGDDDKPRPNRLLIRTATNAYFAQQLTVISIPEPDTRLKKAVEELWDDFLLYVDSAADLDREWRKAKVSARLQAQSRVRVLAEILRKKAGVTPVDKSIKEAEIETMLSETGEDSPESYFHAEPWPMSQPARGPMLKVDRVVLIHRLREVTAQIGFTRFEAATPDIDGELALDVRRAALAREAAWVPAIENRGEGVLISFRKQDLDAWCARPAVRRRVDTLHQAHEKCKSPLGGKIQFPGPRYLLLHSLSHLLITSVSLACGYAASSIRERIYVSKAGSAILLYTGTPDAEGTLGGLVDVGRNVEQHLAAALEAGALCSNDPVCASHRPDDVHEERFLHGAACHGCLLIAEPSCERRNEYLDRALVVPTVEALGAEFFEEQEE